MTWPMPLPMPRQNALDHRIGFRMDSRAVQRIVAAADAQEAGGLLEGLVAQARHLANRSAIAERAVGVRGSRRCFSPARLFRPDTRASSGSRSRVQVHADRIDAVFDRRIERARQRALVHVVLILADADGLGIDLHQLGQRVLQAPRDATRRRAGSRRVREIPRRRMPTPNRPKRRLR